MSYRGRSADFSSGFPKLAATPISEVIQTIQVVKSMQKTMTDLAEVVERLANRVLELERRSGTDKTL
ncbi:MAG TPA: hypothetical protein VME47_18125 [Acetobacteraceae bacterium]|nr:hypothetical protein [Acetobacteraceae bacterium]